MGNFGSYFSAKYAQKSAIQDNFILDLMYRLTFPLAIALASLRVSPNSITSMSVLFSMLAAVSLFYDLHWAFVGLWLLSLAFDLCDGTVARMTKNVSKVAFRYDHYSDHFKFALVGFVVVLKSEEIYVALFSYSALFFFMLHSLLNHELSARENRENGKLIERRGGVKNILRNIYVVATTINGHTYLLVVFVAAGSMATCFLYGYVAIVSAARSVLISRRLLGILR